MRLMAGRKPTTTSKRYTAAVPQSKVKSLGRIGADEHIVVDDREWRGSVAAVPPEDVASLLGKPNVLVLSARREQRLDDGTYLEETVHRRFDAVPTGSYDREVARQERAAAEKLQRQRPRPVPVGGNGIFRRRPESFYSMGPPSREDRRTRLSAEAVGIWPQRDPDSAFRSPSVPAALSPAEVLAACAARRIVVSLAAGGTRIAVLWPGGKVSDEATRATLRELAPALLLQLRGEFATQTCQRADHAERAPHLVGESGRIYDVGLVGCSDPD